MQGIEDVLSDLMADPAGVIEKAQSLCVRQGHDVAEVRMDMFVSAHAISPKSCMSPSSRSSITINAEGLGGNEDAGRG